MTKEEKLAESKLKAVAALAECLANDLSEGKLWEGDFDRQVAEIYRNLNDAKHHMSRN